MSVATFPDGNYRRFDARTTTASAETVYTCPTGFSVAYVLYLSISDDGGANRTVTIELVDNSASTTTVLAYQEEIPANQSMEIRPLLPLDPSDYLQVTGSAAGLHVVGAVMEISARKA